MLEGIEEYFNGRLSKYIPNQIILRLDYLEIAGEIVKDREKEKYNFEILTFKILKGFFKDSFEDDCDKHLKKDYVIPTKEWAIFKKWCDIRFERFIERRKLKGEKI